MKIAILTPTFCQFSGIDRVVELEAKDYSDNGNEVTIITLFSTIKPDYAKVIELGMPKNPTLERIYRLFFFLDFAKIRRASSMLEGFDMVITHLYPMNFIASKARKKYSFKNVYRYHGFTPTSMFSKLSEKIYMAILNKLIFMTAKGFDEIYSDSKYVADELFKMSGLKSKVKYLTINKDLYNSHVSIDPAVKKEFSVIGSNALLYIGRISPHKGIDLLLKAFNIIVKKVPSSKLIIIGKPTFSKYFEELKAIANTNVIFKGFVDDKYLPSYYSLSSVYVSCSLWEGFNMPVVEAQACGKPVVVFDIGAHKEVVKNGKIVQPKDIEGFAESVLFYLKKEKNDG